MKKLGIILSVFAMCAFVAPTMVQANSVNSVELSEKNKGDKEKKDKKKKSKSKTTEGKSCSPSSGGSGCCHGAKKTS